MIRFHNLLNVLLMIKPFLVVCMVVLLFAACGTPNSPEASANRFCKCSEALSKAEVKKQYNRIDSAAYNKIVAEHEACMGDENPLQNLESEEAKTEFARKYIQALAEKCPNIARNYGYLESE